MRKYLTNKWIRISLFVMLGAIGGYAYYYFIGCSSNACPITSNPYISSGYGMMIGLLMSFDTKKKDKKSKEVEGEK
jgi:hypothetical protein